MTNGVTSNVLSSAPHREYVDVHLSGSDFSDDDLCR